MSCDQLLPSKTQQHVNTYCNDGAMEQDRNTKLTENTIMEYTTKKVNITPLFYFCIISLHKIRKQQQQQTNTHTQMCHVFTLKYSRWTYSQPSVLASVNTWL